jgi:SAM-dependent methyltransferase
MESKKSFEDHFSQQAQDYALYRPTYPAELFAYLAWVSPGRQLAWDCGTGNGQAALALTEHFQQVVATDASPDQIARAFPHQRIEYRVERAEDVDLATGSADLVTVAIAVHWFDFDQFYHQVERVLKPDGILAVWAYHLPVIDPEVDRVLSKYYYQFLAGYWSVRVSHLDQRYQSLPFPFDELLPPEFKMQTEWSLGQVVGFLNSWSATRKFENEHGRHPVKEIWEELLSAWGNPEQKRILDWPLYMRVGRVNSRTNRSNPNNFVPGR